MIRDDALNSCAKFLGRLAHEIRALNAIGRFDINSVTEDFLVPVLKIVFDCVDLRNLNELRHNFPSVDLGSKTAKMSFQITTDASNEKVVDTLDKFRKHGLEKDFDRVVIVSLTERQSTYGAKSLAAARSALPIAFDPAADVLDLTDLLKQIRGLETIEIERIARYLSEEFKRRDEHLRFRDQLDKFLEFSQRKIEAEKKSKKYIPSIFVETHTTKEEMRFFSNPLFFYRKVQDELSRINYSRLNSLLKLAAEPELTLELDAAVMTAAPSTLEELEFWANDAEATINRELTKLRPFSWDREKSGEKYVPRHEDSIGWSIARIQVEGAANGLYRRLKHSLALVGLMRKKVFLITSMAGQGKTNFVCDLVENQFRAFGLPCVFIPARELNSYPANQRLFGFISNNRYAASFANMHEYLQLFNDVAAESGKPFVIVIDGINEVTALNEFNDELRDFCAAVAQYDHVKVVITCRSEFFEERYASILNEPFSDTIHRVADLRSKMSERSKTRLIHAYFSHFQIKGRLAGAASAFLKNDLLLLRIFCERYENQPIGFVTDIYKGDLFEDFLFAKIGSFPQELQGKALPTLLNIVGAMLSAGDYSKLSVRDFPTDEREVIGRLVADDIILRQEVSGRSLSELGDLVVSFTYDELRDFIIAYKLVTDDNAEALQRVLSDLPGRPILEGVFRYVYLLARKEKRRGVLDVCESAPDFVEHFSLNIHLLPPAVQDAEDVARAKAILADLTNARRLSRVANVLLRRLNPDEPLNASVLFDHLNRLETADHQNFVSALFRDDYSWRSWQERVDRFVRDFCEMASEGGVSKHSAQWLAFVLHVASLASWSEFEDVSTIFRSSRQESSFRGARALVREAKSEALQSLLTDIDEPEGGYNV